MRKLMYSNYKMIISKYFGILKHAKEIKNSFSLNLQKNKQIVLYIKENRDRALMRRVFLALYKNVEEKKKINSKKRSLEINKIKRDLHFVFQSFQEFALIMKRKKQSLRKMNKIISKNSLHDNFEKMKKTLNTEKDIYTEINYKESEKNEDHDNFNHTNLEETKSELEIRLKIKYQNLQKLISQYEDLKNKFSNNFNDSQTDFEKEMSIYKSLIKTQLEEINLIKSKLS